MNMDFPHLQDTTPFPGDDTHVYRQYRNTFDYNVWTPNTRIKLCRVKWLDDYHDVVKFPDDTARDTWFDGLDGETVKLTTNMYIARADTDGIKLPVPYMTTQRYNYIVVDFSHDIVNTPLQAADVQTRYHYFVTGIRAEAPNTTTCTLTRDVWTDYINNTTINGLLLSRGHAPLTETTPRKLLENPRANCRDFTLPDVDYGNNAANIRKSVPLNLQNGARYICLATTFSPAQLQTMNGTRGVDATDTNPSYSSGDGTVDGFAWGAGGVDTSGVTGSGSAYHSIDNLTTSNVHMYALEASGITTDYFDVLFAYRPHIMSQIIAAFVVTINMIRLADGVHVDGVEWHTVTGTRTKLADVNLTPDDFGYPSEYTRLTRLYLAPYAHLEISDNLGGKTRVEIADCGRLTAQTVTSLSYPILRQIAWIDGIGGDGDTNITVNTIDGNTRIAGVPNADMLKTLISHDIPTYALQRRAIDAHRAESYNSEINQGRQNAILTYENGVRSANVSRENTTRSSATSVANTQRSSATSVANTQRSSATSVANTARANRRDTAVKDESNSVRTDNLAYSVTRQNDDLTTATVKINNDISQDIILQNRALLANTQAQALSSVTGAVGTIAGAALTIATGGAAAPLAAVQAVGSATLQGYNASIAITNNADLTQASTDAVIQKGKNSNTANADQTAHAITQATSATTRANTQADRINAAATSAATDMTAASASTANANAVASASTANTNAGASAGTANANAGASRDQAVDNAKRSMLNTRSNADAAWRDLTNRPANPVGSYAGDNFRQAACLDTMTVKVVTEDNGAIAAAGDWMLRYGIASNKLYNQPVLTPCKHYTYWHAADIWAVCPYVQNEQLQTIRSIFQNGVTIWKQPDEIGGDFIHENL